MIKHSLTVLAFVVISFAVQGTSHFIINANHYAAIDFLRPEPWVPFGIGVMLVQGTLATIALEVWKGQQATVLDGVKLSGLLGIFLGAYIAVAEPSKYSAPSMVEWIAVEAPSSLVQFLVFGVVLGAIHARFGRASLREAKLQDAPVTHR